MPQFVQRNFIASSGRFTDISLALEWFSMVIAMMMRYLHENENIYLAAIER